MNCCLLITWYYFFSLFLIAIEIWEIKLGMTVKKGKPIKVASKENCFSVKNDNKQNSKIEKTTIKDSMLAIVVEICSFNFFIWQSEKMNKNKHR